MTIMLARRHLILGAAATLAMPAIAKTDALMRLRGSPLRRVILSAERHDWQTNLRTKYTDEVWQTEAELRMRIVYGTYFPEFESLASQELMRRAKSLAPISGWTTYGYSVVRPPARPYVREHVAYMLSKDDASYSDDDGLNSKRI